MPQSALTGSRIRARRLASGIRQSELARQVGISAAYLNLIEHNRRRIGGKLLVDIARALGAEAADLTGAAGAALIEALQAAAAGQGPETPGDGRATPPETDRVEEFAGRFPGWAALVAAQDRRRADLERTVEALSDRLTHDPFLSTALHDILTSATAIRASAQILVETPDIDREWRDRFQRNLADDSARLAEAARGLAGYLDGAGGVAEAAPASPQEEFGAWLAARGFHLPQLEGAGATAGTDPLDGLGPVPASAAGRFLAGAHVARYREDAARLPMPAFLDALRRTGPDPAALARRFDTDLARAMRRLAALPEGAEGPAGPLPPLGLAVADASGTLVLRKPVEGFEPPRYGAACPLWPLFEAFSRPASPVAAALAMPGDEMPRFVAYAVCQPVGPPDFAAPPVLESTMLVVPADAGAEGPGAAGAPVREVGTGCRICSRDGCPARREASILAGGG